MTPADPIVSIVIPVFNKLAFTRQCLDRIARHAAGGPACEVIIVDNASTDETRAFFDGLRPDAFPLTYLRNDSNEGFARGNNMGARRAAGRYLLFLNNDTLATAGWLAAMIRTAERDPRIGVVGIKQLFPYTNRVHHTGIVFGADGRPRHLYPDSDASLPHVNRERDYQAVTGACLLIARDLFDTCGGFDEGYRNGYEDIDLCLAARQHGRRVVCCTSAFIYHYGQITETRTADDETNAARFASRWQNVLIADERRYFREDRADLARTPAALRRAASAVDPRLIYFADDLSTGSALSWATTALLDALVRAGRPVAVRAAEPAGPDASAQRRVLARHMTSAPPSGGTQVRWSHYWRQHRDLDLHGRLNLELFVINYLFAAPGTQPWDPWLQCVAQNRYRKLPLSAFCQDVLAQVGVPHAEGAIIRPGYAPEILQVGPPARRPSRYRFLTVTNAHDLERYGTRTLLEAYWAAFSPRDEVTLVVKDYGASAGDPTLRDLIAAHADEAAVEYVTAFTTKARLIELYKSCDAFVSAHRGEGYAMKILDALACGLPVITPLFGGPVDFCTPDTCLPVTFTLAPVGDCLDSRSLSITNGPVWAEPDRESLTARMREAFEQPDEMRRLGERARRSVIDRFTWDRAAAALTGFIDAQPVPSPPVARTRAADETSPYWMGCRVSVIIPTCNRRETLLTCLRALDRQSILPHEFEVIVVDDGSTDGTAEALGEAVFTFPLRCVPEAHAGPGAARNAGLRYASGEIVLFIGDDIVADPRLLESHVLAHAARPAAGTAILGHLDWPPTMTRSAVMAFVCGPSGRQFAYGSIPHLPALDFRFFYTSNLSLKRQFLLDAAADGIAFDPDFDAAAFEDAEFAFRLDARGLTIVYAADAKAVHDHVMDLDSFSRREYAAGRMAVVFYRKHPQLDEYLQVQGIGDWTRAVDALRDRPDLEARLRSIDQHTHAFLQSLARTLEDAAQPAAGAASPRLLDAVLTAIFDVARTRGKVAEWYRAVHDPHVVDLAVTLVGCVRRLEFLSPAPEAVRERHGAIDWLASEAAGGPGTVADRVAALERHLDEARSSGPGASPAETIERLRARAANLERDLTAPRPARTRLLNLLRRADLSIQDNLHRHARGFLPQYHAMRGRLKQWLPGRPPLR